MTIKPGKLTMHKAQEPAPHALCCCAEIAFINSAIQTYIPLSETLALAKKHMPQEQHYAAVMMMKELTETIRHRIDACNLVAAAQLHTPPKDTGE